ncbi:Apoptotic protease-activating factor 1 [Holothuria leucospilota]|uniref:Apoptotic protease-activating factor 1 n=1 Tax=Holothuria leucospilota TaxID=206669 RepID=A0A9Q0YNN2_HOLLE|nr:Apoptotic protease-activating factor 1 [Holothuria leucospilota]
MDPRDKWRLRSNRRSLLDIDASEVCGHLVSEGILTPDDSERIGSEVTHKDKAESLLNLLETKGDKAFRTFRETLLKLSRPDLVKKMDETDMTKMPEALRRHLGGDATDKGNIIITTTETGKKRQVTIEDEGSASGHGRGRHQGQQDAKRSNVCNVTVRGDNNVVLNDSKVVINSWQTKRR